MHCLGGECRLISGTEEIMDPLVPGQPRLIVDVPTDAMKGEQFEVSVLNEYGSPVSGVVIEVFGKTYRTNEAGIATVTAEQAGTNIVSISKEGYRNISRIINIGESGGKCCGVFVVLAALLLVAGAVRRAK